MAHLNELFLECSYSSLEIFIRFKEILSHHEQIVIAGLSQEFFNEVPQLLIHAEQRHLKLTEPLDLPGRIRRNRQYIVYRGHRLQFFVRRPT